MINWTDNIGPNFAWSEVVTADDAATLAARRAALSADPAAQAAMRKVIEVAEWVRGLVDRAVHINSGYRGPRRNGSQHDTGHALDLRVDDISPLDLMALVYEHRDSSPVRLRQVIAESNHTDPDTLTTPMRAGGGTWVHVAIATGPWTRPSTLPWATSVAPVSGPRRYVAMEGA